MAIDSAKFLGRKSSDTVVLSPKSVENVSIVASKLIDVDTILKGSLLLDKMRAKNKKAAAARKKRDDKESMREKLGKGIRKKAMSATEGTRDWLNKLVTGIVLIGLVKLIPIIQPWLPKIAAFVDGMIWFAGKVFNITVTLIDWAYKAYDGFRGFIKNIFGEEGVAKFDTLMGNLNTMFNAAIMAVMALLKFKWLRTFAKNLLKPRRLLRKVGIGFKRFIGRGGRKLLKNIGSRAAGILKGGVGKAAGTRIGGFAAKIFGKAAKIIAPAFKASKGFISKFFGKIPIIGPLVVGIVSLLSGEPAAQALFKAVGAALGGVLGSFIPIPIIGTLIGETIGVFVGDLLYTLMFGGGIKAVGKKLQDTFKTFIEPVFNFFRDGFGRFTSNFPTFDVPDVGLQDLYIPTIEKIGLGSMLDFKVPGKVWGVRVPFIPEDGFSLRMMLDSLPKLPDILGWFARYIPGLSTYVEDGRLMKLPQIWQIANPIFMVKHLAKSFLPQWFGDSSSSNQSTSAQESSGRDAETEEEDRGIRVEKLIPHLRKVAADKHAEEEKIRAEEIALKESQVTETTKNIQAFMTKPMDPPIAEPEGSTSSSEGLESYPSYDSAAPQTALIPLPPSIIPADDGSPSGGGGGSSSSSEDPFEAFYAHSGGIA